VFVVTEKCFQNLDEGGIVGSRTWHVVEYCFDLSQETALK